jgi:5-methylcytosine-specific restriction endonuclease McrA
MRSSGETARRVEARVGGRCEYCFMHQALQGAAFHVEHIVPSSRGGPSESDNLAWCCPSCNLSKSDRVQVNDPDGTAIVPLFNPRRDSWDPHFRWEGFLLIGRTAIGPAATTALNLNTPAEF